VQRRQALENITYRNPSGLALLEEEHHEMKETFARNEKELTEELTEHKIESRSSQNQTSGFRYLSSRCLDTQEIARLREGNDVAVDTSLYSRRKRDDQSILAEKYETGVFWLLKLVNFAERGLADRYYQCYQFTSKGNERTRKCFARIKTAFKTFIEGLEDDSTQGLYDGRYALRDVSTKHR
jgi:hypothetical protein